MTGVKEHFSVGVLVTAPLNFDHAGWLAVRGWMLFKLLDSKFPAANYLHSRNKSVFSANEPIIL